MSVDPAWKGLYKAGGSSYLIVGVLYIISFVLLIILGPPPSTGEAYLKSAPPLQTLVLIWASVDILLIPSVLGLYLALKELNKTHMLIATGLWGVAIPADLATLGLFFSLVPLGRAYAAATADAQRAAYVAAADLTVGATNAGFTLGFFLFGFAILIQSMAMLKGVFSKATAYLGIVTGILSLVAGVGFATVPALGIFPLIWFILLGIWWLLVGSKLYKLGRR